MKKSTCLRKTIEGVISCYQSHIASNGRESKKDLNKDEKEGQQEVTVIGERVRKFQTLHELLQKPTTASRLQKFDAMIADQRGLIAAN